MSSRPEPGQTGLTVALVGNYPEQLDRLDGGIEAVMACLASSLAARGVKLAVISPKAGAVDVERSRVNGIDVYRTPVGRYRSLTLFASTKATMREVLGAISPDIVHCHDISIETHAALTCGYATIVTVHGVWQENLRHNDKGRVSWLREYLQTKMCERNITGRSAPVISISPYIRSYYGSRFPGRFFDIPNPVPERYFRLQRNPDECRILFAGRMTRRKGVHDLLRACAELRSKMPITLALAGSWGDTEYGAELRARLSRDPFRSFVEVRGLLSESEILDEFSRAAVLVLPSYQETSPMVLQQAMAARVPIVATRVGGVADLLGEYLATRLLEPGDVDGLARAIEGVLRGGAEEVSAVAEAFRLAGDRFHHDRVAAHTERAYRAVLDGSVADRGTGLGAHTLEKRSCSRVDARCGHGKRLGETESA